MMFAALALVAQPAGATHDISGMAPWVHCIETAARAWSSQRETADVIARGAVASCTPLEPAFEEGLRQQLSAEGAGQDVARTVARTSMEHARSAVIERTIATVLATRAAGPP